jgi:formylmethanofuran dehydrogenase subunit B
MGGIPSWAKIVCTNCSSHCKWRTIRWEMMRKSVVDISNCMRGNAKHVACRTSQIKRAIFQKTTCQHHSKLHIH